MKKLGFIVFIFFPYLLFAQTTNITGLWESHYDKGNQLFDYKFYEEAIIQYKKEIESNFFHEDSFLKIANCYRILGNYDKSRIYYRQVFETYEVDDNIHKFYFAEALLSMEEYEEAEKWYIEYSQESPDDTRPKSKIEGMKIIQSFYQDSSLVSISPFSQNTDLTEFGAVKYGDAILFSSARSTNLSFRHGYMGQVESLVDLYLVKLVDSSEVVEHIKLPKSHASNDGPVAIANDFVVITRNIGKKKEEPINRLGLFFYEVDILEQKLLYEFPHNSHDYSIQHPALNTAGDTLFFSSDMPGGFGRNDLYFSIYDGGNWTSPKNMGDKVNTAGDETFPFYLNGQFYFSSNGHPGIGGLDIYKVDNWGDGDEKIKNMGYPINCGWDDFSIYTDGKTGYFASNRPGGLGRDDIYEFKITPRPPPKEIIPSRVHLTILNSSSGERIPLTDILIINKETQDSLLYKTSQEGEIEEVIEPGAYIIQITSKDYEAKDILLEVNEKSLTEKEITLKRVLLPEDIKLENILFKFDDYNLSSIAKTGLNHIADSMKRYQHIALDIKAHTDSRGKETYNLWLSKMRANSTADYLMDLGIKLDRIKIEEYGETMLLNKCADFVQCREEEHAINRRIVFKYFVDNK